MKLTRVGQPDYPPLPHDLTHELRWAFLLRWWAPDGPALRRWLSPWLFP